MTFAVKFLCSWWGLSDLGTTAMVKRIADAGYDGIEIGIPETVAERDALQELLDKHRLLLVAHQYEPPQQDFEAYHKKFCENLRRCADFSPLRINSHAGSDYWSFERNCRLVERAAEIATQTGIQIVHETHRGRFLYSAPASAAFFERFPDLRVTFDLGHWVCVAGNLLEDQDEYVARALARADHVHARVAFADGPQVLHPFHELWTHEREIFVGWWREIVDRHRRAGEPECTVTLEAGPVLSGERVGAQPVADFWTSNLRMREYLREALMIGHS